MVNFFKGNTVYDLTHYVGQPMIDLSECSQEEVIDAISKFSIIKDILLNKNLNTGSKELILTHLMNIEKIPRSFHFSRGIISQIHDLYSKIKTLEHFLKDTPTFGCEFYIDNNELKSKNRNHNIISSLNWADILLHTSGNKDIRPCLSDYYGPFAGLRNIFGFESFDNDPIELRICPSYAPIIIALAKELLKLKILPNDILIGYSINMVGDDVLEYGLPLVITNYFTGLTPNLPTTNDGEFNFRDVHVYCGATVDPRSGEIMGGRQLNIFAGVTGNIKNNSDLLPYKETLEKDLEVRINRMLSPFLVERYIREDWKMSIYEAIGLSDENIEKLEEKMHNANADCAMWKASEDIKLYDSKVIREKIDKVYDWLDRKVMLTKPKTYLLISDFKL